MGRSDPELEAASNDSVGGTTGSGDMKADWNARAIESALQYIAVADGRTEAQFELSGARDAALFFEWEAELLHPGATVLDIGCGLGRMDRHVAPRVGRLIGIDVSGEMIRRARARLAELRNVEFVEGDGWTLAPIADGAIDLVFSHVVFQHLPRRVMSSYFGEAYRVLKPGGRFLFQVPSTVDAPPPDPADHDTWNLRYHREEELRRQLESIGFEWEGCRRQRIPETVPLVDQIRPRVRRPVAS